MYALRKIFVLWILTAAALTAQTVEGRVINIATGNGIPDVAVGLLAMGQVDYRTTTDALGHFQMEGVKDGSYTPFYNAPDFSHVGGPILPFQVRAGAGPVEIEHKMLPKIKLSGKVLDASGTPVPHATLTLTQATRSGSLTFIFDADATGEFRSAEVLQPGSWILAAAAPPSFAPPEPRDGQRLGWAKTFYGGATDPEAATPLAVAAGGELSHVDIKLAAVPVHRIRGVVLDDRGKPVPKLAVSLLSAHPLERPPSSPQDSNPDDGAFEFPSVAAGEYFLSAAWSREGVKLWGVAPIEMKDRDLEDIALRLNSPFSIQGKVVMEPAEAQPSAQPGAQASRISMERAAMSAEFMDSLSFMGLPNSISAVFNASPDSQGNFTFTNVYPGEYAIYPGFAPPPYYLDSIQAGGRDAPGGRAQILSGDAPITVSYKLNGGTVRGTVEDCAGGEVMLIPREAALRRAGFIRQMACGPNGRFEIPAVRPGDYYSFALAQDSLVRILPMELGQSLINQSARVTVRPNEATLVDLKLIKR